MDILNERPIDYSKLSIPPEKKTLIPKNLFLDFINNIEPDNSKSSLNEDSYTIESVSKYSYEKSNVSTPNMGKTQKHVLNLNYKSGINNSNINEDILDVSSVQVNDNHNQIDNITKPSHTTISTSKQNHNFSTEFVLPHSPLHIGQTKHLDTPKKPIDLCLKRENNNVNNEINITNDHKNPTNIARPTTSFRKRKQSSNSIFRYTTSTPEVTNKSIIKNKDNVNSSSGSDTTISRSSDFASESGLDISPIETEMKIKKPIVQITTTNRKINIPLNVPNYKTCCNTISGNEKISYSNEKIPLAVHSDLASHTIAPSTISTGASCINVPCLQFHVRNLHMKNIDMVRKKIFNYACFIYSNNWGFIR